MKTQLFSAIGIVILAGYALPSQAENPSHIQPVLAISGPDQNSTKAKAIAQEVDQLTTEGILWEIHKFKPIFNFRNYLNIDLTDLLPLLDKDVQENDLNIVMPSVEGNTRESISDPFEVTPRNAPGTRVGGGTR
ncbi:MAG: hypothetical protein ACRC8Y_11130 [Chroococcales cyanobacterium]